MDFLDDVAKEITKAVKETPNSLVAESMESLAGIGKMIAPTAQSLAKISETFGSVELFDDKKQDCNHHSKEQNHRVDNYKAESHRADNHRANNYRADNHRADNYRADNHRADNHRADNYRADNYRADNHRADNYRADNHRADNHRADNHRADNYRADNYRADNYRADNYRADNYRADNLDRQPLTPEEIFGKLLQFLSEDLTPQKLDRARDMFRNPLNRLEPLNPQPLPPVDLGLNRIDPLNPQPLPPVDLGLNRIDPLNPQPLPPVDLGLNRIDPLHPQPLPPVDLGLNRIDPLNPQPLPPVDLGLNRIDPLNPQPLPPVDLGLNRIDPLNPQPLPPVDTPFARLGELQRQDFGIQFMTALAPQEDELMTKLSTPRAGLMARAEVPPEEEIVITDFQFIEDADLAQAPRLASKLAPQLEIASNKGSLRSELAANPEMSIFATNIQMANSQFQNAETLAQQTAQKLGSLAGQLNRNFVA